MIRNVLRLNGKSSILNQRRLLCINATIETNRVSSADIPSVANNERLRFEFTMIFCFTVDTDALCARGMISSTLRFQEGVACVTDDRATSHIPLAFVHATNSAFLSDRKKKKKKKKKERKKEKKISPSKSIYRGQLIAFSTTVLILRDDRFQFFIASAFFAPTREDGQPIIPFLLLFFQKRRMNTMFIRYIYSKLTTNVYIVSKGRRNSSLIFISIRGQIDNTLAL